MGKVSYLISGLVMMTSLNSWALFGANDSDVCMSNYNQCINRCASDVYGDYEKCVATCDSAERSCSTASLRDEQQRLREEQDRLARERQQTRDMIQDTRNHQQAEREREQAQVMCQEKYRSCLKKCDTNDAVFNYNCTNLCNGTYSSCKEGTEDRYADDRRWEDINDSYHNDSNYGGGSHNDNIIVIDPRPSYDAEAERQRMENERIRLENERARIEQERRKEEERQARIREEQRRIAEREAQERIREHNRICQTQHQSCMKNCNSNNAVANYMCVGVCNDNYNSCIK